MTVSSIGYGLTKQYLSSAQEALFVGNTLTGRRMAEEALARGISARDAHMEAEASLVLGQACVLDSRMRSARRLSSRAHEIFVRNSNVAGQAQALAIMSYSASALGMDSEAVRAANDGISLRANTGSPAVQASCLNYLGVASFWAKDFGTASGTLEASICFVNEESDDAAACFHPLVNLCFCEVLRIIDGESKRRDAPDISMLEKLISQARTLEKGGQTATLNQGTSDIGFLLLDFSSCFASIRSDRLEDADSYYLACLNRASRLPRNSWLQAIVL